jgi:expansin (peptidoglycan-binding protein)
MKSGPRDIDPGNQTLEQLDVFMLGPVLHQHDMAAAKAKQVLYGAFPAATAGADVHEDGIREDDIGRG